MTFECLSETVRHTEISIRGDGLKIIQDYLITDRAVGAVALVNVPIVGCLVRLVGVVYELFAEGTVSAALITHARIDADGFSGNGNAIEIEGQLEVDAVPACQTAVDDAVDGPLAQEVAVFSALQDGVENGAALQLFNVPTEVGHGTLGTPVEIAI